MNTKLTQTAGTTNHWNSWYDKSKRCIMLIELAATTEIKPRSFIDMSGIRLRQLSS